MKQGKEESALHSFKLRKAIFRDKNRLCPKSRFIMKETKT